MKLSVDQWFALAFIIACISAALLDGNIFVGLAGGLGGVNWLLRAEKRVSR